MSGGFIFEHRYKGDLWRLEVQTYKGHTRAHIRKWFAKDDEWRRTSEGFTMPLESLAGLTASLMAHHGLEPPEGLENGS